MSSDAVTRALDGALNSGSVKRKSNNTKALKSKARRVAKGSPEVMVKITGFGKGSAHIKAHLKYISRRGELELENERGEVFKDKKAIAQLIDELSSDMQDGKSRANGRDTVHMVLSMPPDTPEEGMRIAAQSFARREFGKNHQYVFAFHTPANDPNPEPSAQPHVHLVVRLRGFDGTKLNPRKADLQAWREAFAAELRMQGIDAEATPAAVRGADAKRDSNAIRHIEKGSENRPARVPRVVAEQVRATAAQLAGKAPGQASADWQQHAAVRLAQQREALLQAAKALREGNQESINGRPDYTRIDPRSKRLQQRAAALHQSRPHAAPGKRTPYPVAGMRNMSASPVVQAGRRAEVLLPQHARPDLGRLPDASDGLRRARAGIDGLAERSRRLIGLAHGLVKDEALAQRLEALAKAMPSGIVSRADALRRKLEAAFTRDSAAEKQQGREPLPARAPGGKDKER